MGPSEREPIDAVIAAHADELLAVDGVVGVGAGVVSGRPVIEVLAETDPEALRERLPSTLNDYPLHVRSTGTIRGLGP